MMTTTATLTVVFITDGCLQFCSNIRGQPKMDFTSSDVK